MVRVKQRYIVAQMEWEDGMIHPQVKSRQLQLLLVSAVKRNLGDFPSACSFSQPRGRIEVSYMNNLTRMIIIRLPFLYYEVLWSAIGERRLDITIQGTESGEGPTRIAFILHKQHISATIKQAKAALIRINQERETS